MTAPPRIVLTELQRKGLRQSQGKGGIHIGTARTDDGEPAPSKHVPRATATRLIELGLATQAGKVLLVTPAGRAFLQQPVPDTPLYLKQRDGLTTQRALSVRDEGEVIRSTPAHDRAAEARRMEAQDARARARATRDRARRAA